MTDPVEVVLLGFDEEAMKEKMTEFKRNTNYVQGMEKEDVIREFEIHWKPVEVQGLLRVSARRAASRLRFFKALEAFLQDAASTPRRGQRRTV